MFENLKHHLNMNYEDDITSKATKKFIKPSNKEFPMTFISILKIVWESIIFILSKFKYVLLALVLIIIAFIAYNYYTKEKDETTIDKIDIVQINKELNDTIKVSNEIIDINSNFTNKTIEIINSNNINKNNINNIINEMEKSNSNKLLTKSNSNTTSNVVLEENTNTTKHETNPSVQPVVGEVSPKVIALTKLSEVMDNEIIELPDLV